MEKTDCLEPWWKCGKSDREWFNFFNNIQDSECNITKEQFEEFFLNKKTGVDKNG
jgi:hypothetical protein